MNNEQSDKIQKSISALTDAIREAQDLDRQINGKKQLLAALEKAMPGLG
jgi:hypothetical protein